MTDLTIETTRVINDAIAGDDHENNRKSRKDPCFDFSPFVLYSVASTFGFKPAEDGPGSARYPSDVCRPQDRTRRGSLSVRGAEIAENEGPFPVVIVIHGGCWLSRYDLHHISPLASEITKMGYATWSLEYRRVGDDGGGWPGTFLDVAEGVDHLRILAREFPLDLDRILVIGHSAGGHLALWAASRHKIPEKASLYKKDPLPIRGVIALDAVGNLTLPEPQEICGGVTKELMGGTPAEVPERYAQGSPLELLPFGIPQVLIHGVQDQIVPVETVRDYCEAADESGDKVDLVLLQEAGHFEAVMPSTFAWPEVQKAIEKLIH